MTLKSITLHRAASDNAGNFVDAGNDLTVGNGAAMIDADRARDIVNSHGATGHYAKAPVEKPKAARKSVASKRAKPAPKVAEPAAPPPPPPPADESEPKSAD
jgi:topoisomerase IA-like protein